MGARAQAKVIQQVYQEGQEPTEGAVYLYTHWGAESIVNDVATALDKPEGRGRWDDDEYLTRIIFDEMSRDEHGTETGYGIGLTEHGDIEVLVIVNTVKGTVEVKDLYEPEHNASYSSFEQFITANKEKV